jgi:16S rRNA (cytidine1402-2'-O)-methyltransferase
MKEACLYVVATPIGNLDDISLRALKVLAGVAVIAAEDTRRTRILLSRHGLNRPMVALQEHNEEQQAPGLIERVSRGDSVALVSDAGTPLLSDPGYRLVKLAVSAGIEVVAVPGASSITAALSICGLPTDRFIFEGFLPSRQAVRLKRLSELLAEKRTMVFFESSHRIRESLADIQEVFGEDRPLAVCREMTKQFETVIRGSVSQVRHEVDRNPDQRRGEFVLVLAGSEKDERDGFTGALMLARALQSHLSASQAARVAAKLHDVSRRDLYRALESGD